MTRNLAILLAGISGLALSAHGANVIHYWDMDTLNAGVPVDVAGGLVTTAQDSSASGGLVLESATYGPAYAGASNYLLTQADTNGTWSGAGNAGDDTILTDHLRASLSGSDMNFGTNDFSFSYWSYNQTDNEGGTGNDPRGPRVFDNLSTTATGIQLGSNLSGIYNFRLDGATAPNTGTNNSVLSNGAGNLDTLAQTADIWTFIAVNVSRSTDTAEVFFNGASQGSYDISGLNGNILPSQAFLEIGAINGGGNGGGMQDAGLDDLAFYDDVLSSAQISGLAAGTLTPTGVPEPSVAILGGLGILGLLRRRR